MKTIASYKNGAPRDRLGTSIEGLATVRDSTDARAACRDDAAVDLDARSRGDGITSLRSNASTPRATTRDA